MRNEVPAEFEFYGRYVNGPERDVARQFYDFVGDLGWLPAGPEWDALMSKLLEARSAAFEVAKTMLRS